MHSRAAHLHRDDELRPFARGCDPSASPDHPRGICLGAAAGRAREVRFPPPRLLSRSPEHRLRRQVVLAHARRDRKPALSPGCAYEPLHPLRRLREGHGGRQLRRPARFPAPTILPLPAAALPTRLRRRLGQDPGAAQGRANPPDLFRSRQRRSGQVPRRRARAEPERYGPSTRLPSRRPRARDRLPRGVGWWAGRRSSCCRSADGAVGQ
jgi:hypothetical protein